MFCDTQRSMRRRLTIIEPSRSHISKTRPPRHSTRPWPPSWDPQSFSNPQQSPPLPHNFPGDTPHFAKNSSTAAQSRDCCRAADADPNDKERAKAPNSKPSPFIVPAEIVFEFGNKRKAGFRSSEKVCAPFQTRIRFGRVRGRLRAGRRDKPQNGPQRAACVYRIRNGLNWREDRFFYARMPGAFRLRGVGRPNQRLLLTADCARAKHLNFWR
jgi:hypothetical protein